jgi:hypothetical protein
MKEQYKYTSSDNELNVEYESNDTPSLDSKIF